MNPYEKEISKAYVKSGAVSSTSGFVAHGAIMTVSKMALVKSSALIFPAFASSTLFFCGTIYLTGGLISLSKTKAKEKYAMKIIKKYGKSPNFS